jgi:hypothetical protein
VITAAWPVKRGELIAKPHAKTKGAAGFIGLFEQQQMPDGQPSC